MTHLLVMGVLTGVLSALCYAVHLTLGLPRAQEKGARHIFWHHTWVGHSIGRHGDAPRCSDASPSRKSALAHPHDWQKSHDRRPASPAPHLRCASPCSRRRQLHHTAGHDAKHEHRSLDCLSTWAGPAHGGTLTLRCRWHAPLGEYSRCHTDEMAAYGVPCEPPVRVAVAE